MGRSNIPNRTHHLISIVRDSRQFFHLWGVKLSLIKGAWALCTLSLNGLHDWPSSHSSEVSVIPRALQFGVPRVRRTQPPITSKSIKSGLKICSGCCGINFCTAQFVHNRLNALVQLGQLTFRGAGGSCFLQFSLQLIQ